MRYSDAPSFEASIDIDAPAPIVWMLVTDINTPARFSEDFQGAEWIDGGPAAGASFKGRNEHSAMGGWETISYVTVYEPERHFEWAVTSVESPTSTWWYRLEPSHDSKAPVRLTHGGRMGPAPSGLSIAIKAMPDKEERIVARRLSEWETNIHAVLEGIKNLAERQ